MSFDHSWIDRIHPEDKAHVMSNATDIFAEESCDTYRDTYRFLKKDGEYAWVISTGKFISFTEQGEPEIYIGADIDITKMKNTEQELIEARQKAEKFALESDTLLKISAVITSSLELEETSSLIFKHLKNLIKHDVGMLSLWDGQCLEIVSVSDESETEYGKSLLGKKISLAGKKSFSSFIITFKKSLMCNDIEQQFPGFRHLYTNPCFESIIGVPLIIKGKTIGLFSIASFEKHAFSTEEYDTLSKFSDNIAIAVDNANLHEKMASMARTDPLTSLYNRHGLDLRWQIIQQQAQRYKRSVSLLIADIDHFKRINDTFGHDIDDEVIKKVAHSIKSNTRNTDLAARFGGEEFIVILPETDHQSARNLAEKLKTTIKKLTFEGIDHQLTISIGVSTQISDEPINLSGLIKQADKCLYQAKNAGRDRVCGNAGALISSSEVKKVAP